MDKYTSKITRSSATAMALFSRLGDLEALKNISSVEHVEHVECTADECTIKLKQFPTPLGFRIIEREPFKMIKYGDKNGKPLSFTLWVQLVEVGPSDTRIRVTLHVSVPMMLRMFLPKKKIQEGVDRLADFLATMPA